MFTADLSFITVSTFHESRRVPNKLFLDLESLRSHLKDIFCIDEDSYYLVTNGRKLSSHENPSTSPFSTVHVIPRVLGGKGGFGSMLRAIGAQIEKTTNREACRDLSGRRLRDINEEQRLKNWIAQQADREREAAERKKKKLERLCQEPKHDFKDDHYDESRSTMTEVMSSSIEQGFKASTSGTSNSLKRKSKEGATRKELAKKKKKKLWIDAEESESSSDESAISENESEVNNDKVTTDNSQIANPNKLEDSDV